MVYWYSFTLEMLLIHCKCSLELILESHKAPNLDQCVSKLCPFGQYQGEISEISADQTKSRKILVLVMVSKHRVVRQQKKPIWTLLLY